MKIVMTQFRDTTAFEDLQGLIGSEVAAIFLARLREFNVPEDRLVMLAEEICYDIASALNQVGDYEIPSAAERHQAEAGQVSGQAQPPEFYDEKTDEVEPPAKPARPDFLDERTDEVEHPAPAHLEQSLMEEKTDEIEHPQAPANEHGFIDDAADELEFLELMSDGAGIMDEVTDKVGLGAGGDTSRSQYPVSGVMSQEQIIKILNEAKSAFV